jgi:hypothetical protein
MNLDFKILVRIELALRKIHEMEEDSEEKRLLRIKVANVINALRQRLPRNRRNIEQNFTSLIFI